MVYTVQWLPCLLSYIRLYDKENGHQHSCCTSHLWPLPPPPPPPRGMLRTLILCLQFPIVTSTLMGTASWQNHDNSPPQSVIILHCHGCLYQTLTFPPHYGDNVKVKSQHICQAIPALLRGLGEAVITNDRCIIHSLWCTSHKTIVFSHPPPPKKKKKNIYIYILTPNTKYDIRWYIVQPYFQVHFHPITCFSCWPQLLKGWVSIIFIGWVYFHLDHTYRVSPVIFFSYQL